MATKKTTAKDRSAEVKAIEARLKKSSGGKFKKNEFITSWSFTRYNDHRQCPLKAKLKHVDKIEEPPNEAMERGSDIGTLAELYVKGDKSLKKLPDTLAKFKEEFTKLRELFAKTPRRMIVEDSWAATKDWKPTVWNDWNGCAVRVKIDVGFLESPTSMVIIDWKTGKYRAEKREEYVEQLELYALTAFIVNPDLEKVTAKLCYLDVGVTFPEPNSPDAKRLVFFRKDVPALKKTWDKRTRAMLLDRSFPARPNDKCRWCHYRKENTPNLPNQKQLCKF